MLWTKHIIVITDKDCNHLKTVWEFLVKYFQSNPEKLLKVVKDEQVLKQVIGEKGKSETQRKHVKQIKGKPLHEQFWRTTEDVCGTKF